VMDDSSKKMSLVKPVGAFDEFVRDCPVRNLSALVEGSDLGVFVVPVSFGGIDEGIDMWFPDDGLKLLPRYSFGWC
jgi:hypothetical protein